MPIYDSQVHCYERNTPARPWVGTLHGPEEVTGDQMVKAMDEVGVAGAILVSPFSMYAFDASYALDVHKRHPTRFALVKPVDVADPAVAETIADWKTTPGTVAIRIMLNRGLSEDPNDPGIKRVLTAAAKYDLPVNLLASGRLAQATAMAAANPDTQLVIDHIGLQQPFEAPKPAAPWRELPAVLALARHPNVAIKISGAGTLALADYPYPDIWAPLEQIFSAFGLQRCLWGTDWTRAVGLLTYRQGVDPFRQAGLLSDGDKAMLMGGALQGVYRWPKG
jgi:L-fuconolactonase